MNILFIGNSYTFFYDMPKIFEKLATDNGKNVNVFSVTRGGKYLYENLDPNDEQYGEVWETVSKCDYDVLFLQEYSYFSLIDYEKFENAACEIVKKVQAKRNILYNTWGRKTGADILEKYNWTSEKMTFALWEAYTKASKAAKAEISPVGMCFYNISKGHPELELYDPDLSHPSYLGSAVVALTHYRKVFGEMPADCTSLKLNDGVLCKICTIIDKTVLEKF